MKAPIGCLVSEALAPQEVSGIGRRNAQDTLSVGVVGLGYTGLPLAMAFSRAGLDVVGYDIDGAKVDSLRVGASYLAEIPDREVSAALGKFRPIRQPSGLAGCDAIVVCVPTPLTADGRPDLRCVDAALDMLESLLRPGMLIVIQSTVPPGTTLSRAQGLATRTGMRLGIELFVAVAPERIDPGNSDGWTVANTPRLIGGVTDECGRRAAALFATVCDKVITVSRTETAEAAKVFENTFRLVNIALTYELAMVCEDLGISTREVIDAAATKPFGFLSHRPGPGVGGECIPVDPLFLVALAERSGRELPLVSGAYAHVVRRPGDVVERLARVVKEEGGELAGAKVLLAGASYKPEVGDTRNAPSVGVVRELRLRGALVAYADPFVTELTVDGETVPRVLWDEQAVAASDYIVLLTPHKALLNSTAWSAARLTLDTWHVLAVDERVFWL